MVVSATWLANPDIHNTPLLLDFGRGVVRGLSGLRNGTSPIHVLSIRAVFQETRISTAYRLALNLLATLREVEALPNGYWVPTPYRLIECGDATTIFVGTVPFEDLPFKNCKASGLARLVDYELDGPLPRQDLCTWAGVEPFSPIELVEALERRHASEARTTLPSDQTEYLKVLGGTRGTAWSNTPTKLFQKSPVALCRERGKYGTRYFLGSVERGRLVFESPLQRKFADIFPAIASARGAPLSAELRCFEDRFDLTLPRPIPEPLRRIFTLLATSRFASRERLRVSIPPRFYNQVSIAVSAHGYALESA